MAALPLLRDVPARSAKPTTAGKPRKTAASAGRPKLVVVPRRRRWPAMFAALACVAVLAGLLGAAVFHTQLAERQLRIDRLERAVGVERERFDDLRHERAVLRSPSRLAAMADELGMVRGSTSTFIEVSPEQLARQLAAAGAVDDRTVRIIVDTDPLDQFRDVKSVSAGQP